MCTNAHYFVQIAVKIKIYSLLTADKNGRIPYFKGGGRAY
jgi:hypothetical protein